MDIGLAETKLSNQPAILWAKPSKVQDQPPMHHPILVDLIKRAKTSVLRHEAHAVKVLASAGKVSLADQGLVDSREAFKDSDVVKLLALSYQLTNEQAYLSKAKELLLTWAEINKPTGNPIDETRLDGFIWAYGMLKKDFNKKEQAVIEDWFQRMHQAKLAWKFGPLTKENNHRIHHLKIMILLDSVLNKTDELEALKKQIEALSAINLNKNGISKDYEQRDSLHYHNYVLQPWLEISLLTGMDLPLVMKGFHFLVEKMKLNEEKSDEVHHEFAKSIAPIDKARAKAGFKYANQAKFDTAEAAPTIIAYYTLCRTKPTDELWQIVQNAKPSPNLSFLLARQLLWEQHAKFFNLTENRVIVLEEKPKKSLCF